MREKYLKKEGQDGFESPISKIKLKKDMTKEEESCMGDGLEDGEIQSLVDLNVSTYLQNDERNEMDGPPQLDYNRDEDD